MNFPQLVRDLKDSFPLTNNEEIKLMQLYMCGMEFVSAGITTWNNTEHGLIRFTQQLLSSHLRTIADKTDFYKMLMKDLDNLEKSLLVQHDPDSLRKCLYVYCLSEDKRLKFSGFSRTSKVPVDKD